MAHDLGFEILRTMNCILERYKRYGKLIRYPGDWGERAFRAWLVYEIFHKLLKWPIENIVFGEIYDVIFVDDQIRPVIYLETKKPEITLTQDLLNQSIDRAKHYFSLQYVVLSNGIEWYLYDMIKELDVERLNFNVHDSSKIQSFFNKLYAMYYVSEVVGD